MSRELKRSVISWALAGLGLFLLLKAQPFIQDFLGSPSSVAVEAHFYLPSPVEEAALDDAGLWPTVFNAQHPLRDDEVPELFSALGRVKKPLRMPPAQIEESRRWAVLVKSGHIAAFQALPRPAGSDCSLLIQEWRFRKQALSRAKEQKDLRGDFRRCQPDSLSALWWDGEAAIQSQDSAGWARATEKIRVIAKLGSASALGYFAQAALRRAETFGAK